MIQKYAYISAVVIISQYSACLVKATVLFDAADSLQSGQSIKIATNNLASVVMPYSTGTSIFSWGNTGVWDPLNNKAIYIGKQASNKYRYYRVEYNELTNTWNRDGSLHPDLTQNQFGHGYDGTAINPANGDIFFRKYGIDEQVYTYSNDFWSELPKAPGCSQVAETIEYWEGRGVVFSDVCGVRLFDGASWATIIDNSSVSSIGYHSIGEYQPQANVYVFGGGNDGPTRLYRVSSDNSCHLLGTSPIGLGNAAAYGQGILVHDPSSTHYIAWDRQSTWYQFDPVLDSWTQLNICGGSGITPCDGTPNYQGIQTIAVAIPEYGVMMFAGHHSDDVWLYKHTDVRSPPVEVPKTPENLSVKAE